MTAACSMCSKVHKIQTRANKPGHNGDGKNLPEINISYLKNLKPVGVPVPALRTYRDYIFMSFVIFYSFKP